MSAEVAADAAALRIDKWLWFSRFYKTRSLAAKAVSGGHVRINGQRIKPSREVVVGDTLAVQRGSDLLECLVQGIPQRRGPAAQTREFWEETAESAERRSVQVLQRRAMAAMNARPTQGRPDKRTRRLLRDRVRGS